MAGASFLRPVTSRRLLQPLTRTQTFPQAKLMTSASTQQNTTTPSRSSVSSTPPASFPETTPQETYTHFGYTQVPTASKASRVANVFSSVATSYDRMNDLMSLGVHRLWKDHFVRGLNPGQGIPTPPITTSTASASSSSPIAAAATAAIQGPNTGRGWNILDVAGGTGDIAFRMLQHAHTIHASLTTHVTISDINPDMLSEGRKRAVEAGYDSKSLSWLEANAEDLHDVPDDSIDLYTVAFGIRNFTDKEKALREAYRVLRPGGVFACLEFSNVTNPLLDAVYKRWSFGAIPLIGQLVAGDRHSYQYLVESIDRFPKKEVWRDTIRDAGFMIPGRGWEDMTGGIAAIHKGVKPIQR